MIMMIDIAIFLLLLGGFIYLWNRKGVTMEDEHDRMHRMGIEHGHNKNGAFISTREKDNPRHKHD